MRDHDNMPLLNWTDDHAAEKAMAQILHQEPVILQMPDSFDASLDSTELDCFFEPDSGIYFNCEGGQIIKHLAEENHLDALLSIADACVETTSRVDVNVDKKQIIIHD